MSAAIPSSSSCQSKTIPAFRSIEKFLVDFLFCFGYSLSMMNAEYDPEPEITASVNRQLSKADRFDNYREIKAKFDSTGACGHAIKKGDRIGWNKKFGCRCSNCWSKWVAENQEADAIEQGYMNSPW
jgi:hypothetical protein